MPGKKREEFSNVWKKEAAGFPIIGKKSAAFSNHWKKTACLFPIIGKLCWGVPARAEAPPLLGPAEERHLVRALAHLNMTAQDLSFAKDHAKPEPALQNIRDLLAKPLGLPPLADRVLAAARDGEAAIWALAGSMLEVERTRPARKFRTPEPEWPDAIPPTLRPALAGFLRAARAADTVARRATENLAPEDMNYLAASFFAGMFNAEDRPEVRADLEAVGIPPALVREVIEESDALDPAPAASNFLVRLRRADLGELLAAGRRFQEAAARLASVTEDVTDWPATVARIETDLGPVFIGTPGGDTFSESALLILDPGGDDVYQDPAGAADGRSGRRLAAIVDRAGNDGYKGESLLGAGAALFGVAVVLDLEGDDRYEARYAGQAAAFGGAAWLEDRGGDDVYRAGGFAQAAAFYGAAVLRERGGREVYEAGLAGQAYAGVLGFALLADATGNDRYFAGGREPDHERNDDKFLSLAQGFSIGMRPWAGGGVAALADFEGNDTYSADIYAQGVSYWYSVGLLLDAAGDDAYQVHQYGQGAGIHLSLGLLADGGGDDQYTGGILVQGAAHDYGVGMLFERGGADAYTADHHAQGRGLNNALALLVEGGGDDAYFGRDSDQCQGVGNDGGHREYGSLALLLDLAGRDRYSCGAADGARMKRPDFGIVYDVDGEEPRNNAK